MDLASSPLLDRYVPTKQAGKNFDANYWRGFRLTVMVSVLLLIVALFVLSAIFKTDLLGVVLGDKEAGPKAKGIAYGILGLILVVILGAFAYYVRKQGGLLGIGSDARQTGYLSSPDVNSKAAVAQQDLLRHREAQQAEVRSAASTLQARAIEESAVRSTVAPQNALAQLEGQTGSSQAVE